MNFPKFQDQPKTINLPKLEILFITDLFVSQSLHHPFSPSPFLSVSQSLSLRNPQSVIRNPKSEIRNQLPTTTLANLITLPFRAYPFCVTSRILFFWSSEGDGTLAMAS